MTGSVRIVSAAALLLISGAAVAAEYEIVIEAGDAAPGHQPGVVIEDVNRARHLWDGTLDVNADIDGTGLPWDARAQWYVRGHAWIVETGVGQPIPGTSPPVTADWAYSRPCSAGWFRFTGDVDGRTAVSVDSAGTSHLLWYEGATPLPDAGPDVWLDTSRYGVEAEACVAADVWDLSGNVTFGNDEAVILGRPGALTIVAREGDPTPVGNEYAGFRMVALAPSGTTIAFEADHQNPPISPPVRAIYVGPLDDLRVPLKTGDPAPGGGLFTDFDRLLFAGENVLFVWGEVYGAAGIWAVEDGQVHEVVRVGRPGPDGAIVDSIPRWEVNRAGGIAVVASADGLTFSRLYRYRNGVVETLLAAGDPAPGSGDPQNEIVQFLGEPDLDDQGHVTAFARFVDWSERGVHIDGLFHLQCDGSWNLVVKNGTVLDLDGYEPRVVTAVKPASTFASASIRTSGEIVWNPVLALASDPYTTNRSVILRFTDETCVLFQDGFESGTLDAWSVSATPP